MLPSQPGCFFVEPHRLELTAFEARKLGSDQRVLVEKGGRTGVGPFSQPREVLTQLAELLRRDIRTVLIQGGNRQSGVVYVTGPLSEVLGRRNKRLGIARRRASGGGIAGYQASLKLEDPVPADHHRHP